MKNVEYTIKSCDFIEYQCALFLTKHSKMRCVKNDYPSYGIIVKWPWKYALLTWRTTQLMVETNRLVKIP